MEEINLDLEEDVLRNIDLNLENNNSNPQRINIIKNFLRFEMKFPELKYINFQNFQISKF